MRIKISLKWVACLALIVLLCQCEPCGAQNGGWDLRENGKLKLKSRDFSEAESLFKRALKADKAVAGAMEVGEDFLELGLSQQYQGQYSQADKYFKQALSVDKRSFGADGALLARDYDMLAILRELEKRYADEIPFLKEVLARNVKGLGGTSAVSIKAQLSLTLAYYALDQCSDADSALSAFYAIASRKLTDSSRGQTDWSEAKRVEFAVNNELPVAQDLQKRALEAIGAKKIPNSSCTLRGLALACLAQNDVANAETLFEQAAEKDAHNVDQLTRDLIGLALLHEIGRDFGKSYAEFDKVLALARKEDTKRMLLHDTLENMGRVELKRGNTEHSAALYGEAQSLPK